MEKVLKMKAEKKRLYKKSKYRLQTLVKSEGQLYLLQSKDFQDGTIGTRLMAVSFNDMGELLFEGEMPFQNLVENSNKYRLKTEHDKAFFQIFS